MQEDENAREENNDFITAESEPKMADHCDPPLDNNEVGNDLNSSDSSEDIKQLEDTATEQPQEAAEPEPPADTSGGDIGE